MNIDLGRRRSFSWLFIVADVSHAIVGADFLTNFSLQVDLRHRLLVDTVTSLSVNAFFSAALAEHVSVAVAAFSDPFDLLLKYPTLTRPPEYHRPVLHPVVHRFETTGQPVYSLVRCLAPERLKIAKDKYQHMLNLHKVPRRNKVPRPNGNWCPCDDYRGLNAHTTARPVSNTSQSGFHAAP